jgi:predicted membrane GTPase involved in stress response
LITEILSEHITEREIEAPYSLNDLPFSISFSRWVIWADLMVEMTPKQIRIRKAVNIKDHIDRQILSPVEVPRFSQ